ncbi:MAG: SprT family zinc-dependent metalloprotease [Coriobacteriaceae bacterium]|nr:SprT family zinc-dependent metalloprotease [Coriobacteriaceae bacterium]
MAQTDFMLTARGGGLEVPVRVTRKRVKNLNLRVRSDGSVALSIPVHASAQTAQAFLDRKSDWIAAHVLRVRQSGMGLGEVEAGRGQDGACPDGTVPGGGRSDAGRPGDTVSTPQLVPLWGELVAHDVACEERLAVCEAGFAAGSGGCPVGPANLGELRGHPASPANLDELRSRPASPASLDELYRSELLRVLPAVASRMEARIGVHAARWSIRVMKTRWGSCTPSTGAIRINARLAAYPPECLECVVAHELVHLMEPSHNERFHALLDEFYPNNREVAKRLKRPAAE